MPAVKVDVRPNPGRLNNMEYGLVEAAREKAKEGFDQLAMRLFIEEEIKEWKKRDKWKNSTTYLNIKSRWEMALVTEEKEVVIFKTVI